MMNKYKEAYGRIIDSSGLKIHVENGLPMNQDTKDVLLVQELVDRATPNKPIKEELVDFCEDYFIRYSCPICNYTLKTNHSCSNNDCRQAIDWSNDEN